MAVQQAESGKAILRCSDHDKKMHPFCNVGGIFLKELAKYLEGGLEELVEIDYSTNIQEAPDNVGEDGEKFGRSFNLPRQPSNGPRLIQTLITACRIP